MESTAETVAANSPSVIRGSCACGQVVFHSSTLPISITLYHYTQYRKTYGSPFLSFGLFHNSALQWSSTYTEIEALIK